VAPRQSASGLLGLEPPHYVFSRRSSALEFAGDDVSLREWKEECKEELRELRHDGKVVEVCLTLSNNRKAGISYNESMDLILCDFCQQQFTSETARILHLDDCHLNWATGMMLKNYHRKPRKPRKQHIPHVHYVLVGGKLVRVEK